MRIVVPTHFAPPMDLAAVKMNGVCLKATAWASLIFVTASFQPARPPSASSLRISSGLAPMPLSITCPRSPIGNVIDFAVVGRARSFDEVSPFSKSTPFAESSPILDSIRENIHGIDLQPFLFGEVDAGVRGFARRRLGAERVP